MGAVAVVEGKDCSGNVKGVGPNGCAENNGQGAHLVRRPHRSPWHQGLSY